MGDPERIPHVWVAHGSTLAMSNEPVDEISASLSLILSFCLYTNENTIVQTLKIVQLTNSGIPFHHASLPTGKFLLL